MNGDSFFPGAIDLAQHISAKQASPAEDDLTHGIDLYDSEILQIEKVLAKLKEKAQHQVNYQHFQDEIKERFAEIGFRVDVSWWETNVDGLRQPEITIQARMERHTFDRDRMTHEVTNDILDLGEGGVIKTDKSQVAAMMDGSYRGNSVAGAHKH